MKLFIQSPDAQGRIDPPVENILRKIPGVVHSAHEADVVLVPVTRLEGFRLADMNLAHKPWVLVDYCELGWDDANADTHQWGENTWKFKCFDDNSEWQKLDALVRDCPPALRMIRELKQQNVSERVVPIDYLCNYPIPVPQSKAQFEARPFAVFYSWGRSHEARMKLHGDMFARAGEWEVVSEFKHMDVVVRHPHPGHWVAAIHSPWYARIPMEDLFRYQEMAKISVSMPGSGMKCFRHAEAPLNALMAMPDYLYNLAWAFPWDSSNSLYMSVEAGTYVTSLRMAAGGSNLYDRYRAGVENACRYAPDYYHRHHTLPAIAKIL